MTDVMKDVKEAGKDMRNMGREAAQNVQSDLKDAGSDIKNAGREAVHNVQDDLREAGQKMTDAAGKDYDSIKADLDALRGDVAQLLKGLGREAGGTVESVKETITEKAGDVKDTLEKRVQEQPMMTLLGAFGVGLLVARLMR
jgi:ElaB/YqjD/DUF883 family membrane-anchored ribosome-binding protein